MSEKTNETLVVTGKSNIEAARLLALKGALKLEIVGLRRSGRPASVIVREVTGFATKNKKKLLEQYENWLRQKGILFDGK
jgi:hypothetical protein